MEQHISLFCQTDLRATLEDLSRRARMTIGALTATQIDPRSEELLLEKLKHDFVVNPLRLCRDNMTREGPREVDIPLDGQFNYYGPVIPRGIEVTFVIPFEGDPWLFQCRPNSWTAVYPKGQIVGHEYRLILRDTEKNADRMKLSLDHQVQQVEDYIRRQQEQVNAYNRSITTIIKKDIEQRRSDLQANVAFAEAFGVPERKPNPLACSEPPPIKSRPAERQEHKPKVFICYAKEDAAKADEIFRELDAAGADPWLDKEKLVLGDDWEHEIKEAVRDADAFVACLRPGFDDIGFRQQEVRWAIEALQHRPPGRGFIIPFIIEPCGLPGWCSRLHAGGNLSKPTTKEELVRAVEKHCSWSRTRRS